MTGFFSAAYGFGILAFLTHLRRCRTVGFPQRQDSDSSRGLAYCEDLDAKELFGRSNSDTVSSAHVQAGNRGHFAEQKGVEKRSHITEVRNTLFSNTPRSNLSLTPPLTATSSGCCPSEALFIQQQILRMLWLLKTLR
ncbi:hypothetical protein L227DRAFT_424431 [Lentinus tigrinus ALCF2SS1-6]|uniref:Uncharacterized protein n=1 Tax=Lentinus tigrinus ALCF2SS1-6 TaxID=1328759 RepID=A0A5C2RN62_9APHY|nr:hypothetical protein L227DRAFT_424431 [Lentinus tigrinus ALCF2SS1-6]